MREARVLDENCTFQFGSFAVLKYKDGDLKWWRLKKEWIPTISQINRSPWNLLNILAGENNKWTIRGFNLQNATLKASSMNESETFNILDWYKTEGGQDVLLCKEPDLLQDLAPTFCKKLYIYASNFVEVEEGVAVQLQSQPKNVIEAYWTSVLQGLIHPWTIMVTISLNVALCSAIQDRRMFCKVTWPLVAFLTTVFYATKWWHRHSQTAKPLGCSDLPIPRRTSYLKNAQLIEDELSEENTGSSTQPVHDNSKETVMAFQDIGHNDLTPEATPRSEEFTNTPNHTAPLPHEAKLIHFQGIPKQSHVAPKPTTISTFEDDTNTTDQIPSSLIKDVCIQEDLDIRMIIQKAQTRWLQPVEVYEIFHNYNQHIELNLAVLPTTPQSASLFLLALPCDAVPPLRTNGHNWHKKSADEKSECRKHILKIGSKYVLHCYFHHGEDSPDLHMKAYLLDSAHESIILVHYREVEKDSSGPIMCMEKMLHRQEDVQIEKPFETKLKNYVHHGSMMSTEDIIVCGLKESDGWMQKPLKKKYIENFHDDVALPSSPPKKRPETLMVEFKKVPICCGECVEEMTMALIVLRGVRKVTCDIPKGKVVIEVTIDTNGRNGLVECWKVLQGSKLWSEDDLDARTKLRLSRHESTRIWWRESVRS
ncbi:unnamed protein product [Calypogeia fissa]